MSSDHSCADCSLLDRRRFLASASVLSVGMLVSGCGDGVISGPDVIPAYIPAPFRVNVTALPELAAVGGRAVVASGASTPVLLQRIGAQQFRALSLVCPHRGSIVNVESDGLRCPNHGARFARDGSWIGGQPTANLTPLDVKVNADGSLTVGGALTPPALALNRDSVVFLTTPAAANPAAQLVELSNTGGGMLGGLSVSLAYGANQRTGWLSLSLSQAAAPATLTVTPQRGTLPVGNYTATVTVSGAGTSNAAQTLSVSMLVQDPATPASLQLSASSLSFLSSVGSAPVGQSVQCNNGGGGTLTGLTAAVAYGVGATGWLTLSFNQTAAPATLLVRPAIGALAPGSYSATVTVSALGVAAKSITVTLTISAAGLTVTLAAWPALANVGGVAGTVGNVNGGPVAVTRLSATSFAAFSMRCPHAGTIINVVNGASFRCPNHGALFNSAGEWQNSPQRADNLSSLTVIYAPGSPTLTVL